MNSETINDMFVVKLQCDGTHCGYVGGNDNVVYDIRRAAIFRVEDIAKEVREDVAYTASNYAFDVIVVKVKPEEVL